MADRYKDLTHSAEEIDNTIDGFATHAADSVSHVTASEKESWNAKQDTLMFDTVPTENSTNPVTSGGVYPVAVKAVDEGAKNLINSVNLSAIKLLNTVGTWSENVYTRNNIEWTVNADGTISVRTVSGASIGGGSLIVPCQTISSGAYMLSGCPSGSDEGANFDIRWGSTSTYRDVGNGKEISVSGSNNVYVRVNNGVTISSSIVFKPMICTAADWAVSQKFVPYRPSYDELIARIEALEGGAT